jgi:hypothetical protein
MNVLAHLLSAPLSKLSEASTHDSATRIPFGSRTTEQGDEERLQLFSGIFDLEKGTWAWGPPMTS